MKTSLPRLLLLLGIAMTIGGVGGTGYFYREMKIENLKHARTGDVALSLGAVSDWKEARFNVFREGTHTLILTARPGHHPADTSRPTLEIEVADPSGATAFRSSVALPAQALGAVDAGGAFTAGSFSVADPGEEPWSVRARITSAGAARECELSVLPPQRYDIGAYLEGGIVRLIVTGATGLAGFILIVAAATWQRRAHAQGRGGA